MINIIIMLINIIIMLINIIIVLIIIIINYIEGTARQATYDSVVHFMFISYQVWLYI